MARAAVTAEIARLDAISRTRSLDEGEASQLSKLIAVERQYDSRDRQRREART